MKRRKKIYLYMTALLLFIYIVLVMLLYFSEYSDSSATIRTFSDAFWYSLVTLTTVGYGDLTPVTPLGHGVGVVFLFLSAGMMMTLFGAVISFVTSEGLPFLMLGFQRRKNWYYFADYGAEANTLAENIYKEDPDAVIIYGEKRDEQMEFPDYPCLFLSAFHSYDCCARQYWRSRALCSYENTIVLIGFGNYGRCILERAILTNIISVDQHVAYHIFGDAKEFLAMHSHLDEMFSLGEESEERDSLIFHDGLWESCHTLLERADRIIICPDDEPEGWNIFWRLNQFYKIHGQIHLHSNRKAPGVCYFGTNEEIYTPNQIMRTALNRAAITINEIFCKSVSYPTLSWDELDDFHRESKITAADHLLMKIRILLEDETLTDFSADTVEKAYEKYCETKRDESVLDMYRKLDHLRWLRFYTFYNWSYGAARNDDARVHPMLSPYAQLTPEQKKERDAAWELLGSFSVEL